MNNRFAFVAAPLLVLAYGVIRILDGLDGSRGPGLAWTTGHLAFMAALVLFGVTFHHMWRMLDRHRVATVTMVVGVIGLACTFTQFAIDVAIGFMAADHDAMGPMFDQVKSIPGASLAIYDAGPFLFFLAQFVMVAHLAVRKHVKVWTPALVLIDLVLPVVNKDLIPLGAICLLVSFLPLVRGNAAGRRTLVHA